MLSIFALDFAFAVVDVIKFSTSPSIADEKIRLRRTRQCDIENCLLEKRDPNPLPESPLQKAKTSRLKNRNY